jgi:hypothetical protein
MNIKMIIRTGLMSVFAMLSFSFALHGGTILPGWILFTTDITNTEFQGIGWKGVGYSTFTFGSFGEQSVGSANFIIQNIDTITAVGASSPIQLVGAQIQTTASVPEGTFYEGSPSGYYYITLDTTNSSTGTVTIDSFPNNTSSGMFHAAITMNWDLRYGGLTGSVIFADTLGLVVTNVLWGTNAPSGALELSRINYLLNGSNTLEDFWPSTIVDTNDGIGIIPNIKKTGFTRPGSFDPEYAQTSAVIATPLTFTDPDNANVELTFIDTLRPTVTATISGETLIVSWTPLGGTLESTPSLSGGQWTRLGTNNPSRVSIGSNNLFLRVSNP